MSMFFIYAPALLAVYLGLMALISWQINAPRLAAITWIPGVWILSIFTMIWYRMYLTRPVIATTLISLWALRLLLHWYLRPITPDARFEGKNPLSIFASQLPLFLAMAIPVYLLNRMCQPGFDLFDVIGFWIWVVGFVFEALSDFQLARFARRSVLRYAEQSSATQDERRKILTTGLWRFSRHPNYFGEILMWLGLSFMALSVPYGYCAFIGPVAIALWLVFFGGIPGVERQLASVPEYGEYQRRTSAVIPWLPKK